MPKTAYTHQNFTPASLDLIGKANTILDDYERQGYDLTLRQLYYQFVSRGFLENKDANYKRLGGIVNDARLAGLIDWNRIEDRTRNLAGNTHWNDPSHIIGAVERSYMLDRRADQEYRPEVWVEKEALAAVIERSSRRLDVDYFACRGYVSQSEMWRAGQRLLGYCRKGQQPVVIHLGDHDPSGIDMTRDIEDRLTLFCGVRNRPTVVRIALTMAQVRQYNPPPNPAKLTDSRATDYIENYGDESWELDALDPATLDALITDTVARYTDDALLQAAKAREADERAELALVSTHWESVRDHVRALENGDA